MSHTTRGARPAPRRGRDDGGTALLEFTLVAVLLLTIVFAIINFGLILSFKQDMTRAAAEGARAGAVAFPASEALAQAQDATDEAVEGFDKSCAPGSGLTCNVNEHDCGGSVPDTNGDDPGDPNCVTVELVYDYDAHPLLVPVPMISAFLPDEVRAQSTARTNT